MLLSLLLVTIAILLFGIKIATASARRTQPQIHGAFVIPGYPVVGNTFQVLHNPSKTFIEWSKKYRHSTFVIHLGSVPVVVVNDRKDVEYLWTRHSTALNSRPTSYTFHKVISASQGPTIGTTPAGASFRKTRKILSSYLSTKSLSSQAYTDVVDQSSRYIIQNVLSEIASLDPIRMPFSDVSVLRHFQCYVLRCSVMLTYGITLDTHGTDRQLADRIIETENHIINFRSFISNYQDYLPIFRLYPFSSLVHSDADFWKSERDKYIDRIQTEFETRLQKNDPASSTSMLARIMSEKSSSRALTHQEGRSLCLTMISAGLDNLGFTMNYIIGQLSSQSGYKIQARLLGDLLDKSGNDVVQAWNDAAKFVDCDFAIAIIQEGLRSLSVLPLGLPRVTTKPLQLGEITIPGNTVIIMNVFAANHDPRLYCGANTFQPERWLDKNGKLIRNMNHLTFGLGSRKCAGDRLSLTEMYTLLCRFVLVFHIRQPRDPRWVMESDPFISNSNPAATSIEPREFRVWLRPRQGKAMHKLRMLISKGS